MATIDDLKTASPGQPWTAEEVRLLGELLDRRVSGPGVYQDDTGDLIDVGSVGEDLYRYVVLRKLELKDDGAARDLIKAQQIQYKDSPPQAGRLAAYGLIFEVFPMLGHTYGSYNFLRSVFPLIGELKDEVLNANAFFAYKVVMWHGRWMIEHLPKMFENVQAVDVDHVDYSGGGGT